MPDQGRQAETEAAAGIAGRWDAYTASAIGADHLRAGRPNEDAVGAERFALPDSGSVLAFAVADGHGHARHFRSARGASFAVAAGLKAARAWATSTEAGMAASRAAAGQLVTDLVGRWLHAVAADLAADPVGRAEAAALLPGDAPEIPYGATLLLAVIRPDVAVLAQIGDGDILLVRPDGRHLAPVPEDSRLDGTHTTSLCQPGAVSAFRVALVNLAKTPVYAIFAATDGYGNAQADENWRAGMAADLVSLGMQHGAGWLGDRLSEWTGRCASSDGSGDDTTAALSLNTAAALSKPAQALRSPAADHQLGQTRPSAAASADGQTSVVTGEPPQFAGPPEAIKPPQFAGPPETVRQPQAASGPQATRPQHAAQPPQAARPRRPAEPPEFAGPPAPAWATLRWLVAALAVAAVAVVIFLVLRSNGPAPAQPSFSPAASPTANNKARPSPTPTGRHRKSQPSNSTSGHKTNQAPNPATSTKAAASAAESVAG